MGTYDIYAMPNITNEDGIFGMFQYVSAVSNHLFFNVFLWVIFLITWMVAGRATMSFSKGLTFAGFIGMISSMILAVLGFVGSKTMYLMIIIMVVGAIWNHLENSD